MGAEQQLSDDDAQQSIARTQYPRVKAVGVSAEFGGLLRVQVAQLALKHRQNKNQRQRIVLFTGSPITTDQVRHRPRAPTDSTQIVVPARCRWSHARLVSRARSSQAYAWACDI